ncbi:tRNA(Arg) A34 adenosine deaminase TadA [Micromonospora kangleipakensis]|uniref:tRNA(Arg) A34 adenosine deaminase TadA n=1 Tax=Micromonospora kangleipakensis TaxID=1077942 RepID=A0A4Q8BER1_9ACTN|nr:nucleoside deaminase [Micromonospora kangleipakensis]RZU76437.1 tRNA(Arg) A34 adenosine deaminase TadA [Micromonospora kangleipakensis]
MDALTETDERHLRRAVELAGAARDAGDGPFGSLLVDADGRVLAEEVNTERTDDDITAHPELKLARWAARQLAAETAAHSTMYTSCQPCRMCATAIERSGLGRVVYALSAEQLADLRPSAARTPVAYAGPALYDEARAPVEGP